MNKIDATFAELRKKHEKAFIPFLTCGYPTLAFTARALSLCQEEKADIVELGIPFSDPLADGPLIQMSSHQALAGGITLRKIFDFTRTVRKKVSVPLVVMGYYNPLYHYGVKNFIRDAKESGIEGLICPDLPVDEAATMVREAKARDFSVIFLATPVTPASRLSVIGRLSSGFIYYVSLTGTTGVRNALASDLSRGIARVRRASKKPVCVGFGISQPVHARRARRYADGVIVGSALIRAIARHKNATQALRSLRGAIKGFSKAVKGKAR
jgi:tryptophan synthase alpha chain